jgi:hypothetical protein
MTTIYVQEYAGLAFTAQGDSIPVPAEPPLASYAVVYTAGLATGPNYNPLTKYLTVENDSLCAVRFDGKAAVAGTDKRLTASPSAPLLVCVAGVNPSPNPNTGAAGAVGNVQAITTT